MSFRRRKILDLRMNKTAKKIIAKNIDLRMKKGKSIDTILKTKKIKRTKQVIIEY